MSQPHRLTQRDEQKLRTQLEDARLAVDVSLRELAKRIDERDALKAELVIVLGEQAIVELHHPANQGNDRFIVPWGFCEDDDA